MKKRLYILYGWFFVFCFLLQNLNAQRITVRGNWVLDLRNEITEAGSDYIGTYTSNVDQTTIQLRNVDGSSWSVSVRYAPDSDWDNALVLRAQRTGPGTGTGMITGGTAFQTLTLIDALFFTGTDNRNTIPIQYQLSGVSVTIPVITSNPQHRAMVFYTLTSP
jgi:hypothetical protein